MKPEASSIVDRFMAKLYAPDKPPLLMGIVNSTPDSFFADSRGRGVTGLALAFQHIVDGADVLDIGGESTRPGAAYVEADEEIGRIVPLIESIRRESDIIISVDTRKYDVARAALDAGANIINDISAFRDDDRLADLCAEYDAPVILMHMQGDPKSMQKAPQYHDVVSEVADFLQERIRFAQSREIPCEKIIIDPGIGFGKNHLHNLQLLRHLDQITALGYPVLMGHSRKSVIGRILAESGENGSDIIPVEKRLFGSLAIVADSYYRGARIFRVHDVAQSRDVLNVCHTISTVQE